MNQPRTRFAIESDPTRRAGQPCIGGTRIPVEYLLWFGTNGFREQYPDISDEQIAEVLKEVNAAILEHCQRQPTHMVEHSPRPALAR